MAYYYTSKLLLLATLVALATTNFSTAIRPPGAPARARGYDEDPKGLAARLRLLDGESSNCWDSLVELQACTGEVILFFLNGETYLGPSCCRAIRIIGQQCWPAMFGSIGFTAEEADVLQGFCEGLEAPPSSPPPPQAPPSQPPTRAVFVGN